MRMYPIQDGPSVPWESMAPHESQCQKNHCQSIDRIAERGGFGCAEAWCVVNGLDPYHQLKSGETWEAMKLKWIEYAERINLHYNHITTLLAVIEQCEKALALVEFSFKDEAGFMSARGQIFQNKITNALTAIKRVKE